jgi:hydroxyacylglutathione hydrolase
VSTPLLLRKLVQPTVVGHVRPVTEDIWVVRGGLVRGFNVYLIEHGGAITMFDTGIKPMLDGLHRALSLVGKPLQQIVLSHAHGDHRGCAGEFAVPVLCHPAEVSDAEGDGGTHYFRFDDLPTRLTRNVMPKLSDFNDGGPVKIDRTLSEGDEVAGFTAVECPGHSPGQIALWRENDRTLLAGDAFMAFDLMRLKRCAPTLGPRAFCWNEDVARGSLRKLAGLDPLVALPGHGPQQTADVAGLLHAAANMPSIGRAKVEPLAHPLATS